MITGEHLRTLTLDAFEGVENNYELLLGNLKYIKCNKILNSIISKVCKGCNAHLAIKLNWREGLEMEKIKKINVENVAEKKFCLQYFRKKF